MSIAVIVRSSDEDTEDASESEMDSQQQSNIGSASDKLSSLKTQLKMLEDGTDIDYLNNVTTLSKQRDQRLFLATTFRDYELSVARDDLMRDKEGAVLQYESKKAELKDCLLSDLADKRRAYDNYRNTVELGNSVDSIESKTMSTRKLRRRAPVDSVPSYDKRRKGATMSSLVYVLEDNELEDDLRLLCKGKPPVKKHVPVVPIGVGDVVVVYEARVEDGRLCYEGKWFHKGQQVFVVSKEHGQESGVITSISQSEIWVKRLPDNSKLRIYTSQLTRGKYILKRRSA